MSQSLPGFPSVPHQRGCLVVSEPAMVSQRLAELHATLDEGLLKDVNEHGYRARIEATELHPTTAAGSYHWIACVFAIRSMLVERGWKKQDTRNCPFIVSPDRSVAIAVMTGDPDTGKPGGNPTNQAEKGTVLKQAVAQNQLQLKLFNPGRVASKLAQSKEATQLWVLLYHVAVSKDGKNEVRVELSLPSQFERKRIVGWTERIILASLKPDHKPAVQDDSPTGPIDVPVERRTGT